MLALLKAWNILKIVLNTIHRVLHVIPGVSQTTSHFSARRSYEEEDKS